ncbi:MAG: hypothetical protein ACI80V_001014 [Rhodothermales bacterium]|jgi:hypothetical protein
MGDDVLPVKVPPGVGAESVEELTFSFENGTGSEADVLLTWGTVEARFHE